MKSRKDWHKLKSEQKKDRRADDVSPPSKKPPAHTDSPGGSRQGNAGMEEENDGARR